MSRAAALSAMLAVLFALAPGLWPPSVATAATANVTAQDYFFTPGAMTVNVGDTVTWNNPTATLHTTTSDQTGVWSGDLLPGGSFSFTFTAPGVYHYHCVFHVALGMTGTITVNDTSTPPTSTPTTIPTATAPQATPTQPSGSVVGGQGFTLSLGSTDLSWNGGNAQSGYAVLRLSLANGVAVPPGGQSLAASAVGFSDPSALPDPAYCYAVLPLGTSGPIGQSDLLCLLTNTAFNPSAAASHFSIQLNQSQTTTLRWGPPSGATGLDLVALPLNGAPARVTTVGPTQQSMNDNTSGVPTCYMLLTINGATVPGNTGVLCAVPGFSRF